VYIRHDTSPPFERSTLNPTPPGVERRPRHQLRTLVPRVTPHMKFLGDLVTLATHDFRFQVLSSFPNPFAIGQFHPFLTTRTPRVWMRVCRIFLGPEEAHAVMLNETDGNMLTNKGFRLRSMSFTMDWAQ
jgi:hypothetical protein